MNTENFLKYDFFKNINLNDPFFNSLKEDYSEFCDWFEKKSTNQAYYYDENGIQAFLYLKIETEELSDFTPALPLKKRIKIGTLKINPKGTRLGERFIKKAIDYAITNDVTEMYVTVFEKHNTLIELLERYGFKKKALKSTQNGTELVLIKDLLELDEDALLDYPTIVRTGKNKFLLGIKPEYHTRLFPDSILTNENGYDLIKDVSHTNSIEKVYICWMSGVLSIKPGDSVVIYRMSDNQGPAEYRSVATSLCSLVELKTKNDFSNLDEFLKYCSKYSVFSTEELTSYYGKRNLYVLRMTYNFAFKKRVIRQQLADEAGLDRSQRWGIMQLRERQFEKIIELGGINESFIVNKA